jgi:hypothetical protein
VGLAKLLPFTHLRLIYIIPKSFNKSEDIWSIWMTIQSIQILNPYIFNPIKKKKTYWCLISFNGSGCCVHPHVPSPTLGPWVATGGEGSEGATGGASVEAMDGEFLPLKLGGKWSTKMVVWSNFIKLDYNMIFITIDECFMFDGNHWSWHHVITRVW